MRTKEQIDIIKNVMNEMDCTAPSLGYMDPGEKETVFKTYLKTLTYSELASAMDDALIETSTLIESKKGNSAYERLMDELFFQLEDQIDCIVDAAHQLRE